MGNEHATCIRACRAEGKTTHRMNCYGEVTVSVGRTEHLRFGRHARIVTPQLGTAVTALLQRETGIKVEELGILQLTLQIHTHDMGTATVVTLTDS